MLDLMGREIVGKKRFALSPSTALSRRRSVPAADKYVRRLSLSVRDRQVETGG
jgi:hypothetical protein